MADESANRSHAYDADRASGHGSTRLGSTTVLTGDIEAHEDLIVEGRLQGKIVIPSGTLTVAKGAKVEAEVKVRA
ncbi:MAG: polymer-forming cytoskeletal protein, partial [Candidatus Aminicenantes bacterium]|nr:polymer-forming cytoskeletal protein [Candidatus Aminicenantes bacterium]